MASAEQLKFELLAVDRASRPIQQVQDRVKSFDRQVKRTSVQMNSFGGAFTGVTKDLRKFSLGGLQQAGYQIGDYAVQVANGTSKMQAFGQQAGQFFQIFGPFGAVLGAAISVFSAFSLAASRASGEAKSAADAIDSLKTAISTYRDATEKALMPSEELIAKFGKFGNDIRQNLELLRAFKADDAMDMVKMTVNSLNTEFEGLVGEVEMFKNLLEGVEEGSTDFDIISGAVDDLAGKLGITGNQVGILSAALKNIQNASTLDEVVTAGNNFRTLLMMIYKNTTDIPPEMRDIVSQIVRANIAAADLAATQDGVTSSAKKSTSEYEYQDQIFRDIARTTGNNVALFNSMVAAQKELNKEGDKTARNYVDIIGSEQGLAQAMAATNQIYAARLKARQLEVQAARDAFIVEASVTVAETERAKKIKDMQEAYAKLTSGQDEANAKTKENAETIKSELSPELMRIKDASEMVGQSFGDAMTSMVDGTMTVKDAFNKMARDIISDLFQIFVVKRATGMIESAVGLMGGPNPFAFKAIGGPVQSDKPYVVGERGPEMFVPSRSGSIVPNNKIGGGGGVVVNQTINVTTGVQQTVRAEIKQLMPQIADSAKAAVVDAKRRGGSYGRAFA